MKFSEAKEKLKKIAGGRYHSISYEFTEMRSGQLQTECRLYLDQGDQKKGLLVTGNTFQACFDQLEKIMRDIPIIEEIPDVEG